MIVAIDGPAGSGKSTVAKKAAQILGFRYLDTGAMYRAIATRARDLGIDYGDAEGLQTIARRDGIEFGFDEGDVLPSRIFIAGIEVTQDIRTPQIDRAVSPVSACGLVREALVAQQRALAERYDFVVEGRDIGTVVFPDAAVKVFLTAGSQERARRRAAQNLERGLDADFDAVLDDIVRRDQYDSTRELSPLKPAEDAVIIDSTIMTIDYATNLVVELANKAGARL